MSEGEITSLEENESVISRADGDTTVTVVTNPDPVTDAMICNWSDGQYGSITCEGDCVAGTTNVNGTWSSVIVCFIDGVPSHAGAYRPCINPSEC